MLILQSILCALSFNLLAESDDFEAYRAQTVSDFVEQIHQDKENKIIESYCDWEIQNSSFPENCLLVFDKTLSRVGSKDSFEINLSQLNQYCRQALKGLPQNKERIQELLNLVSLPSDCRRRLEIIEKDILYIEGSDSGPNLENISLYEEVKS